MHLTNGELRAYLDGESAAFDRARLQSHLDGCPQCQQRAGELSERATWVSGRMQSLEARITPALSASGAARQRLRAYQNRKENTPMLKRIFSRPYRPAWVTLGLVAILALALAFPPARAIANSFLGLFRVQRFTVVQVDPGNLPEQLGSSSQLEALFADDVNVEESGEVQTAADQVEASRLAGFTVRLPEDVQGQRSLKVFPSTQMSFAIDLPRVQAILDEIGRSDIRLPADLDGATVTIDLKTTVTAMYGNCEAALEEARQDAKDPTESQKVPRLEDCVTLVQTANPDVSAPADLDMVQLGQAYLEVLGMTPEEAAQFSRSTDWTSTLVIPIPRYGTSYETVSVDGVEGTLIQQDLEDHTRQYLLIWIKDGQLYALTGPGDAQAALEIANSIK
jgi:hypothetical protein